MKFGLFGGARSKGDGAEGDSLGYRQFVDYVLLIDPSGSIDNLRVFAEEVMPELAD